MEPIFLLKQFPLGQRQRAFTLIELMGSLLILTILVAALVPVLIRTMDQVAGDQEKDTLKAIGDAYRQSVLRNRYIPSYTTWSTNVATEMGLSVARVTSNDRSLPRYFLVDTNLNIAGAGLPYTQSNAGSSAAPVNARMIVLSSIGAPLPNMASGIPTSADFNAIWNWNDVSSTPPSAAGTVGFTRGEDLKIQRIDLSSAFTHLILTSYQSTTTNGYSIDSTNWASHVYVAPGNNALDRYFIKSSNLTLYSAGGVIDSQQILYLDGNSYATSFVYFQNVWTSSINGGTPIGGLDLSGVADRFLKAVPNLNPNVPSGTNQQKLIITNMMTYMSTYITWANGGFGSGANKTAVVNAQSTMLLSVRKIFEPGGGSNDYTPVNSVDACLP